MEERESGRFSPLESPFYALPEVREPVVDAA